MGQLEHYMSLLWCPYVSNMSKVAATHHKCIDNDAALTLVWHTEGKALQYVPLLFCSYDFKQKQGLPDPIRASCEVHLSLTWIILERHSGYASYNHC